MLIANRAILGDNCNNSFNYIVHGSWACAFSTALDAADQDKLGLQDFYDYVGRRLPGSGVDIGKVHLPETGPGSGAFQRTGFEKTQTKEGVQNHLGEHADVGEHEFRDRLEAIPIGLVRSAMS